MKYKKQYKRDYYGKFISDAQHKRNAIRKRNQFLWGIILTALTGAITFSLPQPLPHADAEEEPHISVEVIETNIPSKYVHLVHNIADKYAVDPILMGKIIECETAGTWDTAKQSGYTQSYGREQSWGLVQIHLPSHPTITKAQATDPEFAVEFLAKNLADGNAWMWSCYTILKKRGAI